MPIYQYVRVEKIKKNDKNDKNKKNKKTEENDCVDAQRLRVGGNWEEMYDAVDGTKTWYNLKTKKTTTKDPFF